MVILTSSIKLQNVYLTKYTIQLSSSIFFEGRKIYLESSVVSDSKRVRLSEFQSL